MEKWRSHPGLDPPLRQMCTLKPVADWATQISLEGGFARSFFGSWLLCLLVLSCRLGPTSEAELRANIVLSACCRATTRDKKFPVWRDAAKDVMREKVPKIALSPGHRQAQGSNRRGFPSWPLPFIAVTCRDCLSPPTADSSRLVSPSFSSSSPSSFFSSLCRPTRLWGVGVALLPPSADSIESANVQLTRNLEAATSIDLVTIPADPNPLGTGLQNALLLLPARPGLASLGRR